MNFDFTKMRLESVDIRLYQFVSANLMAWVTQTIIDEIWQQARAVGLREEILQQIHAVKSGDLGFDVVFDYQVNDKPIGVWLNNGFKPHVILPRYAPMLVFKVDAKFPQFDKVTGTAQTTVFASKVNHPGFKGYHFMEKGFQTGYPKLLLLLQTETQKFYEETRLR